MNITLRKIAMLEQNLIAKEEECRIQGYTTAPEDIALRKKLTDIINKALVI